MSGAKAHKGVSPSKRREIAVSELLALKTADNYDNKLIMAVEIGERRGWEWTE